MVRTRKLNYDEIQKQGENGGSAKRQVWLPTEVWLQVLILVSRVESGLRGVQMSCRLLSGVAHCVLHERTIESRGDNERSLRDLWIGPNYKEELVRIAVHSSDEILELPICLIPENIVRFGRIVVRGNLEGRTIEFLRNTSRLFVDVKLDIGTWILDPRRESVIVQHILPLCASIQSLRCTSQFLLAIQSNFPALLDQYQMLDIFGYGELREDEGNDALALFLQWFSTGRADGRPKVADLHFVSTGMQQQLIRSLEKQFVEATTQSPFIVRILFDKGYGLNLAEHPQLQNSITGEQFTRQFNQNGGWSEVLIMRCALSMPKAAQQEWDVCRQKLIRNDWFGIEQKIVIC